MVDDIRSSLRSIYKKLNELNDEMSKTKENVSELKNEIQELKSRVEKLEVKVALMLSYNHSLKLLLQYVVTPLLLILGALVGVKIVIPQ